MAKRKTKTKSDVNTTGVNAKVDTRNRIQFRFWLDANKQTPDDNQLQLIKDLNHFKQGRKFSKVIRDALRLFFALMLGEWGILMELFPGIVQAIQNEARADLLAENAGLKQRVIGLQAVIEESDDYITELEAENDRLQKHSSATAQPSASDEFLALVRSAVREEMASREPVLVEAAPAPDIPQAVGLKASQPVSVGNSSAVGLKGIQGQHVTMSAPPPEEDEDDTDEPLFEVKQHIGDGSANRRFIQALLDLQKSPEKDD